MEHSDDDNDYDCFDKHDYHSFWSNPPENPSDQRSNIGTPIYSNNNNTSTSNGSSNTYIGSVRSINNYNTDDDDGSPSPTTEVTNENGHDGADNNVEKNDGMRARDIGTTSYSDYSHTLNNNNEEHENKQQELSGNGDT